MKSQKMSIIILLGLVLTLLFSLTVTATNPYDEDFWTDYEYSQDTLNTFFGLGITMCIILLLVPLIIAILAAIWIYKDAEKRGKSGILWVVLLIVMSLILSFIGFIIIIVVWLVVRPPIGGEPGTAAVAGAPAGGGDRRCTNCGRNIPNDARVCPYCGKNFDSQQPPQTM